MQYSHSIKQTSPILALSLLVFGLSLSMCLIYTESQASKNQTLGFNPNSWQTLSGQDRRYMNSPLSFDAISNSSPKHSILELLSPNSPIIIKIHIPTLHVPQSNITRAVVSELDSFSQNIFSNISKQTSGAWLSNLAISQNLLEQDNHTDYSLLNAYEKLASNKVLPIVGSYLEEQGQKTFNSIALNTNGSFLNNSRIIEQNISADPYATTQNLLCDQNCGRVLGASDKQTWLSLKQSFNSNLKLLTDMLLGRFDTNTKTILEEAKNAAIKKDFSTNIVQK